MSVDILGFLWGTFLVVQGLRQVGAVAGLATIYHGVPTGSGAQLATIGATSALGSGRKGNHVFDADIRDFFGSIDRDVLMRRVQLRERPSGVELDPDVAGSRGDGRWTRDQAAQRYAAGWGDLAASVEYLSGVPRRAVDQTVRQDRHAGEVRRRLRDRVQHESGRRRSGATRSSGFVFSCIQTRRGRSI
ncbi:MAG: hypothetical protein NT062_08910 [Proteobacteria bacterium]|nr:hypothetical protein [Pseudomonadota bacterium]